MKNRIREMAKGLIEIAAQRQLREAPKLAPHIPAMRSVIARLLEVDEAVVSIKATTNEGMGYVGREEGVCAHAVALIQRV